MKLTVHTDGFEGWAKRSLERAKRMSRGEKIEPSRAITFDSPLQMLEILTAERIRLCEVARTQPFTISGLAAALKRDPKSVRRDIAKLEEAGLLRTREEINPGHGRVKIVEPVAKNFSLQTSF